MVVPSQFSLRRPTHASKIQPTIHAPQKLLSFHGSKSPRNEGEQRYLRRPAKIPKMPCFLHTKTMANIRKSKRQKREKMKTNEMREDCDGKNTPKMLFAVCCAVGSCLNAVLKTPLREKTILSRIVHFPPSLPSRFRLILFGDIRYANLHPQYPISTRLG